LRILLLIIPLLFFWSCGGGGGSSLVEDDKTVVRHTVNLVVRIGLDEKDIDRDTKSRTLKKRIKYRDIEKVTLTIYDSDHTYYQDVELAKEGNSWEAKVFGLPTDRDIAFIAKAFDKNGKKILTGKVVKNLNIDDSSIIVPLQLIGLDVTIIPSITNVWVGDVNRSDKTINFNIQSGNSEILNWKIIPDKKLLQWGDFNQTSGKVDLRFKTSEDIHVYFQLKSIKNLKELSYENYFIISNEDGDEQNITFYIYEQKGQIRASIAPLTEHIYLVFYKDKIEAHAIVDSRFQPGKEICKNSFDILKEELPLAHKSLQELFTLYYNSIDEVAQLQGKSIIGAENILTSLGKEIGLSENGAETNLSKFLNIDINLTYDKLVNRYRAVYYNNEDFLYLDNRFLRNRYFRNMLDYYIDSKKDIFIALESYYGDVDKNSSVLELIKYFQPKSDLIRYLIATPVGGIVDDYNSEDGNFSQNGDYYYSKLELDDNESREKLHQLIGAIKNQDFQDWKEPFSKSGISFSNFVYFYSDKNNSIHELVNEKIYNQTKELMEFRPNENIDNLFENLKNRYGDSDTFKEFEKLYLDRSFQDFLDYYKYGDEKDFRTVRLTLDEDICIFREADESSEKNIIYQWWLENDSLPIPYPDTNPIVIENFNGSIQDRLHLKVSNGDGISNEYVYELNIHNWLDENNRSVYIEQTNQKESNSSTSADSENSNSNNSQTNSENSSNIVDGKDYSFKLFSNKQELNIMYGETQSVLFTTSKKFDDFEADVLGVINPQLFQYKIYKLDIGKYQLDITSIPNSSGEYRTGQASLNFMVQNQYYAQSQEIKITISNPVNIISLKNSYTVVEGEERNITARFNNIRGDDLKFKLIENSSKFDAWRVGDSYFSNGESRNGVNYNFKVKGTLAGEDELILRVTDTSMEPEYIQDFPIKIVVEKRDDEVVNSELAKYSCGDIQIDKTKYIYIDNAYGDGAIGGPDNEVELESLNSIYPKGNYLSRIVLLYPVGYGGDENLAGEFYIYNQSNHRYIGIVRYGKKLSKKPFFIKYYDEETNSVKCESHTFSPI